MCNHIGTPAPASRHMMHQHSLPSSVWRGLAADSTVSTMETSGVSNPGRDDARKMLSESLQAEISTRNPPLPWSYFIAQAALLTAVCCAQAFPGGPSRVLTAVGLIAVVAIGVRYVYARPGYGLVMPDVRRSTPYVAAMCAFAGLPALLAIGLEIPWLWLVAGVIAGATTLEMGRRYRRPAGDSYA